MDDDSFDLLLHPPVPITHLGAEKVIATYMLSECWRWRSMEEERGMLECTEAVTKRLNTALCIIYCVYHRTIIL